MIRPHAAVVLVALALAGCEPADNTADLRDFVAMTKASSPGRALDPLPKPVPYQPVAYAAQDLKSPFAVASMLKAQAAPPRIDNGIRPNLDRPREELEKYSLGSLKMVGTLEREGRFALVRVPDGTVQTVQVGNYMGTDYGKILQISESRIELLEIVPDNNGGWVERRNALTLTE